MNDQKTAEATPTGGPRPPAEPAPVGGFEREYFRITQEALAEKSGLSVSTIRRHETGQRIRPQFVHCYVVALRGLIRERLQQDLQRAASKGVVVQ